MSDEGVYAVVSNSHYYAVYQYSDMEPGYGISQLLANEAADIAEADEWDEVTAGWVSTAWVAEEDNACPEELRATVHHPDGGTYLRTADWTYGMRPRHGPDSPHASGLAESDPPGRANGPPAAHPSWRAAAAMPVMLKHYIAPGGGYGYVVDADYGEFVILECRTDGEAVPLASAPLTDPAAIRGTPARAAVGIAAFLASHPEDLRAVGAPAATRRDWAGGAVDTLADGQWNRPEGFPPLAGDPRPQQRPRGRHDLTLGF